MTKTSKAKLDYMAERQKAPEEVAKRVARNKARREAIREGRVEKGDGKELDHKQPLDAGGSRSTSNTRVVDAEKNRGWRKDRPEMYNKR